jgi:hypothetical protein
MWSSVPPGCSGNGFLLQRIQKHAKRNRQKKLSVVFLDLAKAFDTISHKHISEGLKRFGVDSHFIDAVVDLYTDARFDNLATEENEEADLIQEPISHNPHIPM